MQLPSLSSGKLLEQIVPDWPELPLTHAGNCLFLSGKLTLQFTVTEPGVATLEPDAITVNQIFNSVFDIDEFF